MYAPAVDVPRNSSWEVGEYEYYRRLGAEEKFWNDKVRRAQMQVSFAEGGVLLRRERFLRRRLRLPVDDRFRFMSREEWRDEIIFDVRVAAAAAVMAAVCDVKSHPAPSTPTRVKKAPVIQDSPTTVVALGGGSVGRPTAWRPGWGAVLEQLESVLPLVVPVIADLFAWREWVQVMEELERVVPLMLLRFKERRRLRVLQHYESEGIWEIGGYEGNLFPFPASDFVVTERRVGKGRQRGQGRVRRTRPKSRGRSGASRVRRVSVPELEIERQGSMVRSSAALSVSVDVLVRGRGGLGWSLRAMVQFIGWLVLERSEPRVGAEARAEAERAGAKVRLWDLEIPKWFFWSLWLERGDSETGA